MKENMKEKNIRKLFLVSVIVFVLAGVGCLPTVAKAVFSDPIDLTTPMTATDPSIDVDSAGIIHTVWAEHLNGRKIIYAKSTDDGATFPTEYRINISQTLTHPSMNPWIKVDGSDVIHIVWEQDMGDGEPEIYYVNSINHGANFSSPKNISNNEMLSISPHIETSQNDKIHITWTDVVLDEFGEEIRAQVFYTSSTDGGDNFSSIINISNTSHEVDNSVIQANGEFIIVLWNGEGSPDHGIYRVISTDNGDTWGSALNISNDTETEVYNPVVSIGGNGTIHVAAGAFVEQGDKEIFYWRSLNDGASFEPTVNISETPDAVSECPSLIAVGDKTVHIIWAEDICDADGCRKRVRRVLSNTGGKNFSNPSSPGPLQTFVGVEDSDLDIYGSDAYIVWQEGNMIRFTKGK